MVRLHFEKSDRVWNDVFLSQVIRAPFTTGAMAQTSPELAAMMARESKVNHAQCILELGAGTGAITQEILRQKQSSARIVAVEQNSEFCHFLEKQFPEIEVANCCASQMAELLSSKGIKRVESILSALPWTLFDISKQEKILLTVRNFLRENGIFSTIACAGFHRLPAGKRFLQLLQTIFQHVRTTRIVWRNTPPAFVYYCSKHASADYLDSAS